MSNAVPEFSKSSGGGKVGLGNMSAFAAGSGARSWAEIIAIILTAFIVVGTIEGALIWFEVKEYILPRPSAVAAALVKEMPLLLPHLGHTLVELFGGFGIGASIGLILAAVITQFPFAEKIIAPYILILVTTPMLALVPLLIL